MLSETGLRLSEHPLEVTDAGAFAFSWPVCPLGVGLLGGLSNSARLKCRFWECTFSWGPPAALSDEATASCMRCNNSAVSKTLVYELK